MSDQNQKESKNSPPGSIVNFAKGVTINSAKPLPAFNNGSSLAYEARDSQGNSLVAIVSDPKMIPRLGHIAGYDLLMDLSLMRLVAHGVCDWTPINEERYVFLYRTACNSSLLNEQKRLKPQWRHNDVMANFVRPMIGALTDMKERNFFHGSIRASNIFYSTANTSQAVILGDALSVQPSSTQSAMYEPIERAMADPIARGVGSSADDIYAFGVSLVAILRTNNALEGLSDEDIIRRKLEHGSYFAIIGRERFNASILTLLRGVLHDDPNTRWGIPEIQSWVDGGRVNAPPPISRKKAARAINFMGERHIFASSLALELHKNPKELSDLVESDQLQQWIEKSLSDKELLNDYLEAVERVAKHGRNDLDFLVTNVRMALAPKFALYYRDLCFTIDGIGGALAQGMYLKKDISTIKAILSANICVSGASLKELPQGMAITVIKKFDVCRNSMRQTRLGYGIEHCLHVLCEDAFCMSPNLKGMIVFGKRGILNAFEKLSSRPNQTAFFLDQYILGMMAVQDSTALENGLFELNAPEKEKKLLGNLKCLASLHRRSGGGEYPKIANVFMGQIDVLYTIYHNRLLRKKIQDAVTVAAKKGDLGGMEDVLCDYAVIEHDHANFRRVKAEYHALVNEKAALMRGMERRHSFGTNKGHDIAAIVAWLVSGALMVMMVMVFFAGGTIF